jgi:hypothetical protein
MARKIWVAALGLLAATSASAGASTGPASMPAPAASPGAQYCLRVEAVTGTRLESVLCWTRDEWAEQGVNVDDDWAEEGVRVIEPGTASL